MFRIGSVRVAEKATIELYKNINATLPTGKTEGNLAHAFYQVRNSKKDQAGRFDALYLLGDVYEKLALKEVLSGAHSFVKPTIETIATNKDDRLWPEAAEILGLEPQNGYFERKDAYLQQGSDFSAQLLGTTPAKNEHELMILYAIAKHGAKVAEG
ncbi:hypothetical protein AMJ44_13260, partial [candidate division WOR-1 bacterium DG_54_3]